MYLISFPGGSEGKESTCNVGDLGSIPGLGRFPGGGYGSPLQYACLENPMDKGAWGATVHGVAKSQTGLSDEAQHSTFDRQYMIHANVSSHSLLFKIKSSIKEKFKWGTKEKSSKEKKDFLVTQLK